MTDLRIELSHAEDAELLKRCAEALQMDHVQVRALQRFGNSGAELYLASFGRGERSGFPRVVKIADRELIAEEQGGVAAIRNFFVDAHEIEEVLDGTERAAIIYRLISSDEETATAPLHDELCEDIGVTAAGERLEGILERLYGACCGVAHRGERKDFVLGEEYRRYRRRDRSEPRLAAAIGGPPAAGSISYLGAEVTDPRYAVEQLAGETTSGILGAVHGDLHPNNVMLDDKSEPHLIDFAWAEDQAHVIKDFVLMECSLRFLVFPSFADLDTQLAVDRALLSQEGWAEVGGLTADSPLADCYQRLASLVGVIRAFAAQACGPHFDFETEYLAPQLFMLYGLLTYNDYAFYPTSRAAGLIGHKLLR